MLLWGPRGPKHFDKMCRSLPPSHTPDRKTIVYAVPLWGAGLGGAHRSNAIRKPLEARSNL
eukprot:14082904-Alexandrium_andersonii.AAC.1